MAGNGLLELDNPDANIFFLWPKKDSLRIRYVLYELIDENVLNKLRDALQWSLEDMLEE